MNPCCTELILWSFAKAVVAVLFFTINSVNNLYIFLTLNLQALYGQVLLPFLWQFAPEKKSRRSWKEEGSLYLYLETKVCFAFEIIDWMTSLESAAVCNDINISKQMYTLF